jgi:hypothetical protein
MADIHHTDVEEIGYQIEDYFRVAFNTLAQNAGDLARHINCKDSQFDLRRITNAQLETVSQCCIHSAKAILKDLGDVRPVERSVILQVALAFESVAHQIGKIIDGSRE